MLKQYLRWLPAQLGLFNKGAFLLQIDAILPDDIFVASYPKSGNTWLRFILANMKSKGEEITFQNIDQYVPDVYTSKHIINSQTQRRMIKTHQALFDHYPRTVYIYRDYRDVLVSFYHYETALQHFNGTPEEFISSGNVAQPFGSWKDHVQQALDFQQKHPKRMLLLQYEAMLEQPLEHLKKIADFCNLQPALTFEEIGHRCAFAALRENETRHGSDFQTQSQSPFFREGKKGSWRDVFTDRMIATLQNDKQLAALMQRLGYS